MHLSYHRKKLPKQNQNQTLLEISAASVKEVGPEPDAFHCVDAIRKAWKGVTGEEPNLAELQITAANGLAESRCGKAAFKDKVSGKETVNHNNWGAVQDGPPPCNPETSFEASDVTADGTPYNYCYKRYPTPEAGAAGMIRQMTIRRPTSWKAMKEGDIDSWAKAMSQRDPVSGVGVYFEQNWEARAKTIENRVKAIAKALNQPVSATRGGPPTSSRRLYYIPRFILAGAAVAGLASLPVLFPSQLASAWSLAKASIV